MKKYVVESDKPYDILIGTGLLPDIGKYMNECIRPCKVCVVTDSTVNSLYAQVLLTSLMEHGYQTTKVVFPSGEHSKNLTTFSNILEALADEGLTRSDCIVALGGGVVGDLAGFAAASYMRGIPYVQIPTTYLSAIDSSVGGKTSINLRCGKNLAGAFWQPSLVLCDYKTFETLPADKLRDGVSEAVKNAVISEGSLLKHIKDSDYSYVIERCVSIKKSIVEADVHDTGLRQILNFGHTIGYGVEKLSAFNVSHGQAVAKGMVIESRAAYKMGLTGTDISEQLSDILTSAGFNLDVRYNVDDLYHYALIDKKISGNKISMVVPDSIGKCRLQKISLSQLKEFIELGLSV